MSNTSTPENNKKIPFPVVAIGASAGGLSQIRQLLTEMPADTGAAFVVIQHLPPDYRSQLAELLAPDCPLPAITIEDGMQVQADRIHVLPSGYQLGIDDQGRLQLTDDRQHNASPTVIDRFFRDLAMTRGRRAIGIVLSGNGNDGALGLKAIRSEGGLAIAQNPDSAEFGAMPRAAAKYASPDCLFDTADMVAPLCNHLRLNLSEGQPSGAEGKNDESSIGDQTLAEILELLHDSGRHDFRHHKPGMLKRRLSRRMALDGINDTAAFIRTLRRSEAAQERLCSDFLISVTDFFREPKSYAKLNRTVIEKLLHGRSIDDPVRVWVPGCATGEEAYSIAMLLAEAIEATGRDYKYMVFATDIDDSALARARTGLYPQSIAADLSSERLAAFFETVDEHYRIRRNIRECVVFAPQSVTDDPPYSRLDLISCRNLMIYLTANTQKRLITLFHFALKEAGFLFLGSSETVGDQIDLFEPVSREHRLYRRLASSRQYRMEFPTAHHLRDEPSPERRLPHRTRPDRPVDAEQIARDILLKEHVPASVLINRKLQILCSYGPTREYLSLPLGESSLGLLDMVHDEYRGHLRAVTHRAFRHNENSAVTSALQDHENRSLLISARPLQEPEQGHGLVLVTFERVRELSSVPLPDTSHNNLEQQLADELDATRNELHGTIAALESSNEDLKGSNEEIMSMNEELQSTNEELETSKEELQSVNEELTTVNTELEAKVEELAGAHNDLSNLFSGTQVATLFLDRGMHIKRFTPTIRDLLSLISSDIGRPLRDMTLKFADPALLTDAQQVLEKLTPREAEVPTTDGRWYQRRILPYRTRDNVIDGVVITFADITDLKGAMLLAREHEARLDLAVSALTGGMWEMPINPEAPEELPDAMYLSSRLKLLLGFTDEQLPDNPQAWIERILPADRLAFSDATRRRQSRTGQPVHYRIRHRDGSLRWFASYATLISSDERGPARWVGVDCDITDYKQADIRARHVQAQLQLLADALPELIAFVDRKHIIRFFNTALDDWFDVGDSPPTGRMLRAVLGDAATDTLAGCIDAALDGRAVSHDLVLTHRNHGRRQFQASHIPHIADGKVLGFYLLMTDATLRKVPETGHQEGRTRMAYTQRMATIGEMASTLAHDINQPLSAINNYTGGLARMLHAGKPAEDTTPILRKISDQVAHAGQIVSDVRDFVGHGDSGNEPVDLNRVLHGAVSLTASRARKMNVDTRVSEHSPLPTIYGDAVQIQQVLINLINNAIDAMRDTDSDQRTLWISTAAPDDTQVRVMITDSGPGIPIGKLESIFSSLESTKLEGMGMGLAISRSIVEWHGGHLWAESRPGKGARFCLSLPVTDTDPGDTD